MIRAVWDGAVLAEAERTVTIEGNHYFPPESVRREHLTESSGRSLCWWKGIARYYDVTVDGRTYPDAAWSYPRPTFLARPIKDHVAFWPGVEITRTGPDPAPRRSGRGSWWRGPTGGGA